MRSLLPFLASLLVVAVLGGCLSPPAGDDGEGAPRFDPDWSRHALAHGKGHNHEERLDHLDRTTPNFEILGYDPLISPYHGTTPAGYACGDVADTVDERRLAVVESRTDVGFAIADVTDPLAPRWLGELVMPTTRVYDLAVVPDGKHVVLVMSTTRDFLPGLPAGVPALPVALDAAGERVLAGSAWHHACNGGPVALKWGASVEDPVPRPLSILLVDISDPTEPTIVDQRPLAGLGHSVESTLIDGRYWVTASNVGNPNQMVWQFFEVVELPTGTGALSLMSSYASPLPLDAAGADTNPLGGHTDGSVRVHPETGATMGFLVGGPHFIVVDLSNPNLPQEVGYWTDRVEGRPAPHGNLHSAFVMSETYGDRHFTVVAPEFGGKRDDWELPTGVVWVLDTTDPADVFAVGAWTLPHDVEWTGDFMFSNHYLSVLGNTIFVSMYHGGVWAVDLTPVLQEGFHQLPSIGVFLPVGESPKPPEDVFRWAPNLQEVHAFAESGSDSAPGGVLVTFDSMTGLYVFTFDESDPAPAPAPWPVAPVPR